jgi:1-acyl-sn-glycerol-3-phosphate acyltransferase
MKPWAPGDSGLTLPHVSAGFRSVFAAYSRRYVARNFHSLRIYTGALPPCVGRRPLVIYLNHAAWWDPLVCLLLSREFLPARTSFAPIDHAMLARYGFFRRLGFFGLEPGTARGARTFLRTARAIVASSAHVLWVTPQGRFMDVRERPLRLEQGLGALAARELDAAFVPLAIEYAFWTEPRPEVLVGFGDAMVPHTQPTRSSAEWTRVFTQALESTQDALAERSSRRDPADWRLLNRGRSGISLVYDAWRWVRARMRGERFAAEHLTKACR